MKTKFISILMACLLLAPLAGASFASRAMVVGNQTRTTMALAGEPSPAEYPLMTISPWLTYKGGKITITSLDLLVSPGPTGAGQPAMGTLGIFIEVGGTKYIVDSLSFYADPHHYDNRVLFDPDGDTSDIPLMLNIDLQNKIQRNSQIKIGMFLGSRDRGTAMQNTMSWNMSSNAWGPSFFRQLTNQKMDAFYRAKMTVSMLGDLEGGQNQIIW
ncbi:MAG: hypothetical protein ABIJ26_06280 [Candidatus Margulisiibacteriota bacterium]|nr:hypothetical protein [Candidatus Margulisiibacteriota bacterium]